MNTRRETRCRSAPEEIGGQPMTISQPRTSTRKLKDRLEIPYWTRFWGQRRKVKPMFVEEILGNGKTLLGLEPLNTRPHHYFIRIDSGWYPNEEGEEIYEHLDDIYEAIEAEFGPFDRDKDGYPIKRGWPELDLDAGCSWWDATKELEKPR